VKATFDPPVGRHAVDGTGTADSGHGGHLTAFQRGRTISAMFEACAQHGAANVTVAHVVAVAGISRRTFYELFDDCEDCLSAAMDETVARAGRRVLAAYRAPGRWHERVRSSLEALLVFLDSDPHVGRFMIVETLAAGPTVVERRSRLVAQIVMAVHEGSAKVAGGKPRSPIVAEGVVGAVLSVLHTRMLAPERDALVGLLNHLMSIVVLPYMGPAAARRELERPVVAPARVQTPPRQPLAGLGMRLTYRTIQVMVAVGEHPGGSNREVGNAAGMVDQGQISKLLTRLSRLGLIENTSEGVAKGAPNSWRLTAKGRELHAVIASEDGLARVPN
jgi:AcrR family transcriptional regulator/DNA-binding MarR family transcriptional regulator